MTGERFALMVEARRVFSVTADLLAILSSSVVSTSVEDSVTDLFTRPSAVDPRKAVGGVGAPMASMTKVEIKVSWIFMMRYQMMCAGQTLEVK